MMDLTQSGPKVLEGTGGGTSSSDPFRQTVEVDQTNKGAIPVSFTGTVTPAAGVASSITTGGVAVKIVQGPCNGGYITNPRNADAQGIAAAENVYIDPVGASPGNTDALANGTTSILGPGETYTIPALSSSASIHANCVSNGHKLTVVVW